MAILLGNFQAQAAAGGGFVPSDVAGLLAWFQADNAGSITSSGGAVSQWNDLSGGGNHLAQATGANQPTTGTRTINGRNVIDFDGTNDYMAVTMTSDATPYTIIFVGRLDTTASQQNIIDGSGSSNRAVLLCSNSAKYGMYGAALRSSTVTPSTTNAEIVIGIFNGSSSVMYVDGGASVASGDPFEGAYVGLTVGSRYDGAVNFNGIIGEVLIYNSALSSTDLNSIGDYLATRWGMTWTAV